MNFTGIGPEQDIRCQHKPYGGFGRMWIAYSEGSNCQVLYPSSLTSLAFSSGTGCVAEYPFRTSQCPERSNEVGKPQDCEAIALMQSLGLLLEQAGWDCGHNG
jgi:hypothetical protein